MYLRYTYNDVGSVCGFSLWNAGDTAWTEYYFATNLQGDVLQVYQADNNALVATYTYDAWGNILSATGTLAAVNPFRYRGYYFDEESGFYYLQSRYYDPEIGRFINADGYTSTGQGIIGNNMFAYCNNNPVIHNDISGALHERTAGHGGVFSNPGGGISLFQIIKNEVMNEDPAEALDDDTLNFYKGVPVIKTPGMDNASFSFGVIFMGDDANSANLLYHEYGHVLQLREIGVLGYVEFVVVPSVTCFWLTEADKLSDKLYYNLPWENTADRYGGAQRQYLEGSAELADSYWRLAKRITKRTSTLLLP